MSLTLFLIFNHHFTPDQEAAARASLGITRIAALPPELQRLWGQVPPDLPALGPYVQPLRQWLAAQGQPGDYVLIQGDFGATYLMVRAALDLGLIPVYATTWRRAAEEHSPDGTVKLTRHFQHQVFRKYGD